MKLVIYLGEKCFERCMLMNDGSPMDCIAQSARIGSTHEWLCVIQQNKELLADSSYVLKSVSELIDEDDCQKIVPLWKFFQTVLPNYIDRQDSPIDHLFFITSMFNGVADLHIGQWNQRRTNGLKISVMTFYDDVHNPDLIKEQASGKSLMQCVDYVACPYKTHFWNIYATNYIEKLYHWFWHASAKQTQLLNKFQSTHLWEERKNQCLVTGTLYDFYPTRMHYNTMASKVNCLARLAHGVVTGAEYVTYLSNYKACLVAGWNGRCPHQPKVYMQECMAKFIECICAGCVPLVDNQPILAEMGFFPNVHYLLVTEKDTVEAIEKTVEFACSAEGKKIAENAMQIVSSRHLASHRLKDLKVFLRERFSQPKNTLENIALFYINLERSRDRRICLERDLKLFSFGYTERIVANDAKSDTIAENCTIYDTDNMLEKCEQACWSSHIKCLQRAKDLDLDFALIVEDDIDLTLISKSNLEQYLPRAVSRLPEDADFGMLTWLASLEIRDYIKAKNAAGDLWIPWKPNIYSATAYVATRKGMRKMIALAQEPGQKRVRRGWADITMFQASTTYVCTYPFFFERENNSSTFEISDKDLNHRWHRSMFLQEHIDRIYRFPDAVEN